MAVVKLGKQPTLLRCLRFRQKPKAAKHDSDEKWQNYLFETIQQIHGSSFPFPA